LGTESTTLLLSELWLKPRKWSDLSLIRKAQEIISFGGLFWAW
jgi:hypothetical protein